MNKYITMLIVFALVAAGIGELAHARRSVPPVSGQPASTYALVAAFTCDDGSHFIAEFPTMDTLRIDSDGTLLRTLSRDATASSTVYRDADYTYMFGGYSASVQKGAASSTACAQVADQSNPPVNFGN